MQTNFRGRDFIGDLDFTKEEVETVLEVAWDLKRKRALGESHALLRDKTLAMLFFFTGTSFARDSGGCSQRKSSYGLSIALE